jgi:hypothetical protein
MTPITAFDVTMRTFALACFALASTAMLLPGQRNLQMAQPNDTMVRDLRQRMQQDPQYKGTTTLVLTVDHGRGRTPRNWTDHGRDVAGSEEIWMAVMGPDTKALGIRKNVHATQSMIASTVAALLGEDFQKRIPNAAAPLPGVIK